MRKFINAIKVKCNKCGAVYWTEYDSPTECCRGEGLTECMESQSDYNWKKQLESNS